MRGVRVLTQLRAVETVETECAAIVETEDLKVKVGKSLAQGIPVRH